MLILSFPHLTSLDLEGVTFDHQGAPTRLDGREEQYSNINRLAMTLDSDAVSVLDLFLLPSFLRARRLRYLEIKGSSRISGTMVIMHRICALSQVISSLTIISALVCHRESFFRTFADLPSLRQPRTSLRHREVMVFPMSANITLHRQQFEAFKRVPINRYVRTAGCFIIVQ